MGVRLLTGTADGTTPATALYCSSSGIMIGSIWEGDESYEAAEGFCRWLETMPFASDVVAAELDLKTFELQSIDKDGTDPRHWPEAGLRKLEWYYRRHMLDADGAPREAATS